MRTDQDRTEARFNARFESVLRSRLAIKPKRLLDIRVCHRPSVSSAHQARENLLRAGIFFFRFGRARNEDASPAWSIARSFRGVRSIDRHLVNRRRDARMPVHIEMRVVGLAPRFEQCGAILDKRYAELMRPR